MDAVMAVCLGLLAAAVFGAASALDERATRRVLARGVPRGGERRVPSSGWRPTPTRTSGCERAAGTRKGEGACVEL